MMVVVVMVVTVLYLVIIYYIDMSQSSELVPDCQPKTHSVTPTALPWYLEISPTHVNVNVCNRFAWVLMVINSLQGGRYKGENENQ